MQESTLDLLKRNTPFIRMAALVLTAVLLLLLMSQTAFAQNTYVITDGDHVLVHTSSATDPAAVLNEAGLALDADDTYTTQPGIGVSEITIRRSQSVTVSNNGSQLQVNTSAQTVGGLLDELNLRVDAGTSLSVPLDSEISDGMVISLSRAIHRTQTYTAAIPYEVTYCSDPSLPEGEQKVISEGVPGQKLCTVDVVYRDGKEVSRTVIRESVIEQSIDQVIAVGTGVKTEPSAMDGLIIGTDTITLPTGEVLTFKDTLEVKATAYTHTDEGCDFTTATGTTVRIGTVAVDPKLIPYGTRMFIVTNDGSYVYGIGTAEDCGGSIKGERIDLYYPTHDECIQFGVRQATIYFLG